MGKYMRKAKGLTGEVVVMEVQSPLGVRTRARTLALQRLQAASEVAEDGDESYLQLRSRRLQKVSSPSMVERRRRKKKGNSVAEEIEGGEESEENGKKFQNEVVGINVNLEVHGGGEEKVEEEDEDEGSFGENVLELEGRERTTRESTPCNLIINSDSIGAPGSSTKPSRTDPNVSGSVAQNPFLRDMPTAQEMEEFFAAAEKQHQKHFMEKYNFDPAKEKPLSGRYEWVKVDP